MAALEEVRGPITARECAQLSIAAVTVRQTPLTARLSPGLACSVFTVPSRSARSTFSIFIASTTASVSPTLTSCPSATAIATDSSSP